MISPKLVRVISSAANYSISIGCPLTDLVHILLSMLDEADVQLKLRALGANHADLRELLLQNLDKRSPVPPSEGGRSLSPLAVTMISSAGDRNCPMEAVRLIDVMLLAEESDQHDFDAIRLLRSVCDPHLVARRLEEMKAEREQARLAAEEAAAAARTAAEEEEKRNAIPETLAKYTINLVDKARKGEIDPVIGRDEAISRMREILGRRKKNNPILIGEPGVGKTAIVEGLAVLIASGKAGASLAGRKILALDVTALAAGTRLRGELEDRINKILKELEARPDLILFVDEIHVLVGGIASAADAANLLKPALASGRIRCIGATTHGEYQQYFEADPAMARRFQPLAVPEPDRDAAIHIMKKLLSVYAEHHKVAYPEEAAIAAVDLSTRHILTRHLPDKAIDVLDEAGAVASARGMATVTRDLIHEIVSRMSGVQIGASGGTRNFKERLLAEVKGQDEACATISRMIVRSDSGLARPERPRCSMLFIGPKSCGKRFTAETVARLLVQPIHRLDMTDYVEQHSISRLIGSPPGYVGFGSGGELTEPVRRTPTCVVLLDRVDVAHPAITQAIAQAIEKGFLKDSSGREISFSGVTFIMTAEEEAKAGRSIGFTRHDPDALSESAGGVLGEAADAVIRFGPFDLEGLQAIAAGFIDRLSSSLKACGVTLELSAGVVDAVAAAARDEGGNGKDLERAYRRMVENLVLDGEPGNGDVVTLSCSDGRVHLEITQEEAVAA